MPFQKISLKKHRHKKQLKNGFKAIGAFLRKIFHREKSVFPHLETPKKKRPLALAIISVMIIFGGIVIYQATLSAYRFFRNFELKDAFFAVAGTDLPEDKNGFTNILILGVGGAGHDGEQLTDSIIIVSIDPQTKSIAMLSLPRDFWVETAVTQSRINEILRDAPGRYEKQGYTKEIAHQMAITTLENKITEITGLTVQRYAKIDFRGFEKMIDAVGGVDVVVERSIDDPTYPDGNWGVEHFYLEKGARHLDGATALKFARSRHDSSDFDRAARQQKILEAFREKALSKGILTSPDKLEAIFGIVKENFESDLSLGELISLAGFASNFNREKMISRVLTDNEFDTGGFLVTPSRELYGGAFVLVPFLNLLGADKYAQIQAYADLIFKQRFLALDPPHIEVLNGTLVENRARDLAEHFKRYGIKIARIATTEEVAEETVIRYTDSPENEKTVSLLLRFLKAKTEVIKQEMPQTKAPEEATANVAVSKPLLPANYILVIIGKDYELPYRIPR